MVSFSQCKPEYERNWANLKIRSTRAAAVNNVVLRILDGKKRYKEVERRTGVPWWFVALCHYRESNLAWNTYLGNGQPLGRRTTIVPKGRGPFKDFEDGAVDALRLQGLTKFKDWSLPYTAWRLEGFNGYGYHSKGVNSPYLYGGSTCYGPPENRGGKYVRDHVFDPKHIDIQLGTLTILKRLIELEPSIKLGEPVKPPGGDVAGSGIIGTILAAIGAWLADIDWGTAIAAAVLTGGVVALIWHFAFRGKKAAPIIAAETITPALPRAADDEPKKE